LHFKDGLTHEFCFGKRKSRHSFEKTFLQLKNNPFLIDFSFNVSYISQIKSIQIIWPYTYIIKFNIAWKYEIQTNPFDFLSVYLLVQERIQIRNKDSNTRFVWFVTSFYRYSVTYTSIIEKLKKIDYYYNNNFFSGIVV